MDENTRQLLYELNLDIIKIRGVYSAWSGQHGISYNEMLVLYTIHQNGYCTQKQICDSYLLPRQTINHVIAIMRERGILKLSEENCSGREKAFVLTEKGTQYAQPLLNSLERAEQEAVAEFGEEKMRELTSLAKEYSTLLEKLRKKEQ